MSDDSPTPSTALPPEIRDILKGATLDQLRDIAEYANALAEYEEEQTGIEGNQIDDDQDDSDAAAEKHAEDRPPKDHPLEDRSSEGRPSEDRPDGVPSKASTTVKEINSNRYYYWQWRDGDQIRSQYKGPVESGEES